MTRRPPARRASKCAKLDCPSQQTPAGGCPDPVGHLLQCDACGHIPLKVTQVTTLDGAGAPERFVATSCEACGAENEFPPEFLARLVWRATA